MREMEKGKIKERGEEKKSGEIDRGPKMRDGTERGREAEKKEKKEKRGEKGMDEKGDKKRGEIAFH